MVVDEIDVKSVAFLETENDPPIAADRNAPKTPEVSAQSMQAQTLDLHVVNCNGGIQAEQQARNLVDQIGPQFASIILLEQPFETAMPNASDHPPFVC